MGSDNRIFITDPEGFRVVVFSADGKPLSVFGQTGSEAGSFGLPNGIAIGLDGNLWIADSGNNRVVHFQAVLP